MMNPAERAEVLITEEEPCCVVGRYQALGVAVNDKGKAVEWYTKIGFDMVSETQIATVLRNGGGLELHLVQADRPVENGANILMDTPTTKYAGHTHAAFTVPNVPNTQVYLDSVGIPISGTRPGVVQPGKRLFAIFARDPDRTTFEFELNHGEPDDVIITRESISTHKALDHLGIRVWAPNRALVWYAEHLGFVRQISRYELNPDPIKNFAPWITRTAKNCDINFIPNCNVDPTENILTAGGVLLPGILFPAYTVDDTEEAERRLRARGVTVVREGDLAGSTVLQALAGKVVPSIDGKSIFLLDLDSNIIRLVNEIR